MRDIEGENNKKKAENEREVSKEGETERDNVSMIEKLFDEKTEEGNE